MVEKFDIKKFFDLSPTALGKVISVGWKLLIVILIVSTIWRAWFTKNQTQSQRMTVWPFSFSTITYAPQQEQKQEIKKRPWWLPIFFVEGYGFSETSGVGNSRTGVGGRAGGRLEF